MVKINKILEQTQIKAAWEYMRKFTQEDKFWDRYKEEILQTSGHLFLLEESDIEAHLCFMFSCDLHVSIEPYRTKNPWSKVIGHAEGNTIWENTRKINDLYFHERIGHLGHETTHLFGYSHASQTQEGATPIVFGDFLAEYAYKRLKEIYPSYNPIRGGGIYG